jgi:hypothetical protein
VALPGIASLEPGRKALGELQRHFIFLDEDRRPPAWRLNLLGIGPCSQTVSKAITAPISTRLLGKRPHGQEGTTLLSAKELSAPGSAPPASKTHSALSVMGFREFILPILEPTIKKKYERIL